MRLITRANFDGICCAVLITQMEQIEQVVFTHTQDIEDGTVKPVAGDILANLPFHYNASMWFDHHNKAEVPSDAMLEVSGLRGPAKSAARLVYDYYESPLLKKYEGMLQHNDQIAAAEFTLYEILTPDKWVLLSYTLDPYMGLAAFQGYANEIIIGLKTGLNIDQILDMAEAQGRVKRYLMDAEDFKEELKNVSRVEGNVLVTDSRKIEIMPIGNRFIAFGLFPACNVQIVITHHSIKSKVRIRLGKSIINRTSKIHLGRIAEEYGGGGLDGSAGFLLEHEGADEKIKEIISKLEGN